jgi:general stress protein 26
MLLGSVFETKSLLAHVMTPFTKEQLQDSTSTSQLIDMNTPSEIETDNFELEDSDDIIGIARSLVDGHHPGILATVDEDGRPAVRWMSTLAFDEFPIFHTLTRPDSRKVAQIAKHPDVNWMFFNHNRSLILNLIGRARILSDIPTLKRIWKKVVDKSLPYFLDQYTKGPGFVVVETAIKAIECTSPKSALRFAIEPSEMVEPHY